MSNSHSLERIMARLKNELPSWGRAKVSLHKNGVVNVTMKRIRQPDTDMDSLIAIVDRIMLEENFVERRL